MKSFCYGNILFIDLIIVYTGVVALQKSNNTLMNCYISIKFKWKRSFLHFYNYTIPFLQHMFSFRFYILQTRDCATMWIKDEKIKLITAN